MRVYFQIVYVSLIFGYHQDEFMVNTPDNTICDTLDSEKSIIRMSLTPVILSYFAERKMGTRSDITKTIFSVYSKLYNRNIHIEAIFRGNLSEPQTGSIQSETVDEELNYWLSNNFLIERSSKPGEEFCFESSKNTLIENFQIKNLSSKLDVFEGKSECDKQFFIETLKEEFSIAKSSC
jgi:hypothetical protein